MVHENLEPGEFAHQRVRGQAAQSLRVVAVDDAVGTGGFVHSILVKHRVTLALRRFGGVQVLLSQPEIGLGQPGAGVNGLAEARIQCSDVAVDLLGQNHHGGFHVNGEPIRAGQETAKVINDEADLFVFVERYRVMLAGGRVLQGDDGFGRLVIGAERTGQANP